MAAIEIVALILAGLVALLVAGSVGGWWSTKPARPGAPTVSLLRISGFKATHEELHLLVNDRVIRQVSDEETRAADYQARVEELEVLASSLAAALGVELYLRRADAHEHPEYENNKVRA